MCAENRYEQWLLNLYWYMISWGIVPPLRFIGDYFLTKWERSWTLLIWQFEMNIYSENLKDILGLNYSICHFVTLLPCFLMNKNIIWIWRFRGLLGRIVVKYLRIDVQYNIHRQCNTSVSENWGIAPLVCAFFRTAHSIKQGGPENSWQVAGKIMGKSVLCAFPSHVWWPQG